MASSVKGGGVEVPGTMAKSDPKVYVIFSSTIAWQCKFYIPWLQLQYIDKVYITKSENTNNFV